MEEHVTAEIPLFTFFSPVPVNTYLKNVTHIPLIATHKRPLSHSSGIVVLVQSRPPSITCGDSGGHNRGALCDVIRSL